MSSQSAWNKAPINQMTSLPVVIEDVRDSVSDCESDSCGQEALQNLDICLDHLENLQFSSPKSPASSSKAAAGGCPASHDSMPTGKVKSDSGFWSQSFDSFSGMNGIGMASTLEDSSSSSAAAASADVDLDEILGELCALGDELENESRRLVSARNNGVVQHQSTSLPATAVKPQVPRKPSFEVIMPPAFPMSYHHHHPVAAPVAGAGLNLHASVSPVAVVELDLVEHYYKQMTSAESPDNDSAFSDNVSCISSESGASRTDASCMSSGSSSKSSNGSLNAPSPTQRLGLTRLTSITEVTTEKENISPQASTTDGAAANASTVFKAEKIPQQKVKIALEKINETDSRSAFVTVHFNDEFQKSLKIDERMDCLEVCQRLAELTNSKLNPDYTLVEYLPELNMERFFEDHESLAENWLMWERDDKPKLLYSERRDKYHFIARPEVYLVGFACKDEDYDELSRRALLKDYFSSHMITPPDLEGHLYLKTDTKKTWKKYWFVLRSSGLYYTTKPKTKQTSSADLICLTPFDVVNLYVGNNWRKKFKAPSDFGFALKLPQITSVKALKTIKFVCADDQHTLDLWIMGIRIVKYGRNLPENYNRALERAAIMDGTLDDSDTSSAQQTPVVSRRLSSSTHDSSENSAFDDDLTTGTIKRKPPHSNPSAIPKLPFTPKTSQILKRSADERRSFISQSSRSSHSSEPSEPEMSPLPPPPPPEFLTISIPPASPLSPSLLRSPPPTPPKPAALQRKPSLNSNPDAKKVTAESRHSIGPTPTSPAHSANAQVSQLPFLHELRTKSQSPLAIKKVLACVPEIHDILSQPSSPARKPALVAPPVPPAPILNGSPAHQLYGRTQSMSPTHKAGGKLPPTPPRRSDMTKLSDTELALQRKAEAFNFDRSVSLGAGERVSTAYPNFMADLTRVLAQKKRHSALLGECSAAEGADYLPPPPPELLKDISSVSMEDPYMRRKPPPPLPKRSEETHLTRGK